MVKSIDVTKKGRPGRPTTGRGLQIGERWSDKELEEIDKWIVANGVRLSRGQAIRRLVELGLKTKGK